MIPTLSEEGNSHLDSGFLGAHSLHPQTITFQLLQQEPPKRSPLMPVFFLFFFYARTATIHLHHPSAPQIYPQVAGNLIGRSNLTKVSEPSYPYILTLLFSARPPPPPPRLHHSRDLSEGPEALPMWLQCFPLEVTWRDAKSSVFLI